jgi:hypothetical protein
MSNKILAAPVCIGRSSAGHRMASIEPPSPGLSRKRNELSSSDRSNERKNSEKVATRMASAMISHPLTATCKKTRVRNRVVAAKMTAVKNTNMSGFLNCK